MLCKLICKLIPLGLLTLFLPCAQAALLITDVGQTIQIETRLRSFVGRPTWLIEIRDVDHNATIPYIYDISTGHNQLLLLTRGHNYLITASTLHFSPYSEQPYCSRKIHNFCRLESHGHIMRGKSLVVRLEGHLAPNRYRCSVTSFAEPDIKIATPIPD